jgi:hypothetical protein
VRIEILEQAAEDLIDGFHFFEEREKGLGAYFLSNLYADIESLHFYAGIHRRVYKKYHRLLSKRFTFAVFYTVEGDVAFVHAVVDCRKNPAWIRKHLGV